MIYFIFILLILFNALTLAQSEFNIRHYQKFKIYSKEELLKLLPFERQILQAEILANYGYKFKDTLLQKYFNKQIWYKTVISNFPPLIPLDSVNYFLFKELNKNLKNTVFENIKSFKPDLENSRRVYYSYCFEDSKLKSIAKRKFGLFPFDYCFGYFFFKPRFELPIPPEDFERFFSEDDFNLKTYLYFKRLNDVKGILYKVEFSPEGNPLMYSEVGVDPGLNLGKVHTENYLDSLGRVIVYYNKTCNEGYVTEMAKIYTYQNDQIVKEVLLLEDKYNLYVQVTSKDYFYEAGLRKRRDASK